MLTVTDEAVAAINALATGEDVPPGAALRISGAEGDLRLSVAASPESSDTIFNGSGTRIFIEQQAVRAVEGKVLHARTDDTGAVRFTVGPAPS
ncbi:Fe-S cluster assembly iron-binding protein IscA [Asanoa hainanensis]|uniref:Fe-S cluster assembly iron-binding protein IscA n=1 Tax=Asanoa hainanensis TaxID=560556 RepID=A0A239PEX0_9ACTN|nr:hypothetical protein [Asanoa hainanensis]SNT65533.1 Fe-S cluster assembly iron-binding protein IscA [Asanoa hainanensis]